MRRIVVVFLSLFLILIIGSVIWWNNAIKPVSGTDQKIRFVIEKGRNASQISKQLYDKGIIRSPLAFKFYVQLKGQSGAIQAGEFELTPNLTLPKVLEKLSKGPLQLWVTIPEGLRKEEMPDRFVRRAIKRMLPYKQYKGKEAFNKIKCYIGVPDEFKDKKHETLIDADVSRLNTLHFVSVKEICNHLGGNIR